MARRIFCQSQERVKGVTNSNVTMTVDAVLKESVLAGVKGMERLNIFRFIYTVIRQDFGHR